MKVTINVKLVNSKFNQAYADKENEGFETEDNYRFLWEDEFEVQGEVTNFRVNNNASYFLNGIYPNGKDFSFEIKDIMLLECTLADGSITLLPFSKKAVSKTEKQENENELLFNVYLKSAYPVVNPMTGVYILQDDFPEELIALVKQLDENEQDDE